MNKTTNATRKTDDLPPPLPDLITIRRVSQLWGVREDTLRKWARQGKLESVKIGRLTLLRVSDLRRLAGEVD